MSVQALDFLDKLLRYDHQDRLTAKEAMVVFHDRLFIFVSPLFDGYGICMLYLVKMNFFFFFFWSDIHLSASKNFLISYQP